MVQGAPLTACYVVLEGRVAIKYAPIDGDDIAIDELDAGQFSMFLKFDPSLAAELEEIFSAREDRVHRVLREALPTHQIHKLDDDRDKILDELFRG